MRASEARKITEENLSGPAIKNYVDSIVARIEQAAREGRCYIKDPEIAAGQDYPNPTVVQALRQHFTDLGYAWNFHPDQDPGHPASRAYTTLSW